MNPQVSERPRNAWLPAAPFVLSVVAGCGMLFITHNWKHYAPPGYGGFEPGETQRGAIEIRQRGRTDMDFHTPGYPYLVALVYLLLPRVPVSMLAVQIACLPLVVWSVGRISRDFAGPSLEPWGRWAACLYYPLAYYAVTFNSIFVTFLFVNLCLVFLAPLLRGPRSFWRSALVGLGLGVVVCFRPNFAVLGIAFALAIWKETRNLWEAVIRALPIAAVSAGMLVAINAANPPPPGQFLRGSQGVNRQMLEGTYQYADQWWDWEWFEDSTSPGSKKFYDHLRRIEQETGSTIIGENEKTFVTSPAAQAALRRDALKRMTDYPWNTVKKLLISTVRTWIFVPTHLSSMPVKIAITVEEFFVLALALYGLWLLWIGGGPWELALGVLVAITMWSWILDVEPRYSLPGRGVELALMVVALETIWRRLRNPGEKAS